MVFLPNYVYTSTLTLTDNKKSNVRWNNVQKTWFGFNGWIIYLNFSKSTFILEKCHFTQQNYIFKSLLNKHRSHHCFHLLRWTTRTFLLQTVLIVNWWFNSGPMRRLWLYCCGVFGWLITQNIEVQRVNLLNHGLGAMAWVGAEVWLRGSAS